MEALTAKEVTILNNMSREHDLEVLLGTKLQQMITSLPVVGTPVNAKFASAELSITGVVIDGETVTITNPLLTGPDVFEFVTDAALSVTTPGNHVVDIGEFTARATVTLTMDTQPTAGDKVTIGTKVYTFVPVGTDNADGEVSVGADLAAAQLALVAAINGTDGISTAHPLVHAAAFAGNAAILEAYCGGTVGNAIVSTETFTANTNVFSAATLTGGTNCSAANAAQTLSDIIHQANDRDLDATVDGTKVTITAFTAGAAGNNVTLSKSMAHATFTGGATHLSGGVDGTVGGAGQLMIDDTYMYIAIAANTAHDTNWRRIAVGDPY